LANPKFTDAYRFTLPYVSSKEMGEGYLAKRFAEIRARQREGAEERLRKTIPLRKRS
jgi:hypothetical protein